MSLVTPATLASQETVKPVYTPTPTKTGIWESHTQTFYNQGSEHMQKIIEHMQIQSQMSLHKTHYSHILKKKKKKKSHPNECKLQNKKWQFLQMRKNFSIKIIC